eukprot:374130_1
MFLNHFMQDVTKQTKKGIGSALMQKGFDDNRIERAIHLYETNYPIYDVNVIEEIIYRLTIKDKVKVYHKLNKTIFKSRDNIKDALQSMDMSEYFVELAINQYETECNNGEFYDIEQIVEIIMSLRNIDSNESIPNPIIPIQSAPVSFESPKDLAETVTPIESLNGLTETDENQLLISPMATTPKNNWLVNKELEVKDSIKTPMKTPEGHKREISVNSHVRMVHQSIISTEQQYCSNLKTLLHDIIIPIFENKYIDKHKYYNQITSTIPIMIEFHKTFLKQFRFISKGKSMADIFNRYILENEIEFCD